MGQCRGFEGASPPSRDGALKIRGSDAGFGAADSGDAGPTAACDPAVIRFVPTSYDNENRLGELKCQHVAARSSLDDHFRIAGLITSGDYIFTSTGSIR